VRENRGEEAASESFGAPAVNTLSRIFPDQFPSPRIAASALRKSGRSVAQGGVLAPRCGFFWPDHPD
jgi:hypothetical protein